MDSHEKFNVEKTRLEGILSEAIEKYLDRNAEQTEFDFLKSLSSDEIIEIAEEYFFAIYLMKRKIDKIKNILINRGDDASNLNEHYEYMPYQTVLEDYRDRVKKCR